MSEMKLEKQFTVTFKLDRIQMGRFATLMLQHGMSKFLQNGAKDDGSPDDGGTELFDSLKTWQVDPGREVIPYLRWMAETYYPTLQAELADPAEPSGD